MLHCLDQKEEALQHQVSVVREVRSLLVGTKRSPWSQWIKAHIHCATRTLCTNQPRAAQACISHSIRPPPTLMTGAAASDGSEERARKHDVPYLRRGYEKSYFINGISGAHLAVRSFGLAQG